MRPQTVCAHPSTKHDATAINLLKVDAYTYAGGAATAPRPVAADLPNARSPDLRGRYSHALKSVAVDPVGLHPYSEAVSTTTCRVAW